MKINCILIDHLNCFISFTASRGAQKLAPILILLRNVVNCNMRVILSVVEKHSDMPVKKYVKM